jgi:hypothetical protein
MVLREERALVKCCFCFRATDKKLELLSGHMKSVISRVEFISDFDVPFVPEFLIPLAKNDVFIFIR